MSEAAGSERKLQLGAVLQDTMQALRQAPAVFFGLSALLVGLPGVVFLYQQAQGPTEPEAIFADPVYWVRTLVSMLLASLFYGAAFTAVAELRRGEQPVLGRCFRAGVTYFIPIFAVTVISTIGVMGGLILLIIPGLMLLVAWSVAAPALLHERGSPTWVLGRSAELSRGHRWRIFGLFLLVGMTMFLAQVGLGALGLGAGFGSEGGLGPVQLVGSAVLSTLTGAFWAAMIAVLYAHLRGLKEGFGRGSAADVFA